MVIGLALLVIATLIIGIWVVIEMKRMKHKLLAVFLIALILFLYISFSFVFRNQDVEWKTVPGVMKGGKIYLSWLGSIFGNMKSITGYAIGMDWKGNETLEEENEGFFKFLPDEDK